MNFKKYSAHYFFAQLTILSLLFLASCITDPGLAKNRGLVKDFSIVNPALGCETSYLILSQTGVCTTSCGEGTHLATSTELTKIKNELNPTKTSTSPSTSSTTITDPNILEKIAGSAGVCIDDVVLNARPTNQIDIRSDFCSCINGKSDLISDCASFCSTVQNSTSATLYLNTIMGTDIALNTKLGNLFNWCTVQLDTDVTKPQCFLSATDGTTTINNIDVNLQPGSNSLNAKIDQLALDRTYIVKIIEGKSGSNAQSKEFQLRRKTQPTDNTAILGALKITPINQYTCMSYGIAPTSTTDYFRTTYARVFYYFAANETPLPIPPPGGSNPSTIVCHDEQLHPGNDSAEYPRLELIPQHLAMWDLADTRFVNENKTTLTINKILTARLFNEFKISATLDLFNLINYPNRPTPTSPSTANLPLGYIMIAFTDKAGKTFCPTQADFNGTDPLFNLLKDYMDDTEGLYLAEKEAETIQVNSGFKTIYGTMLVTESIIKKYGFYIQNGLKIKADQSAMNTKTIYYYWPTNDSMDPLAKGNRRLFTVKSPDTLNGNVPTGQATSARSTDKRIGCVPKSH